MPSRERPPHHYRADQSTQRLSRPATGMLAGTVELRIPRLRKGSYFAGFLEPQRLAEKALAAVAKGQVGRLWP